MGELNTARGLPKWAICLLSLAFAAFSYTVYASTYNPWIALAACVGILILLAAGDLRRLWNVPSLLFLGYVVFSFITLLWAMSGKFFLREYMKIVIAVFFFLLIVLLRPSGGGFVRRVMGMVAGACALFAFLSIEAASTGYTKDFLISFAHVNAAGSGGIGLSAARLSGVFGNSNVESAVYSVGILFSLPLVCGAEKKTTRALCAVVLSLNMCGFLLVLSLGAMACFVVAVIVYLIFAREGRFSVLIRFLETVIPTILFAFLIVYTRGTGNMSLIPVYALCNAAVTALLELFVTPRLVAFLEARKKAARLFFAAVVVLVLVYVGLGLLINTPYTFGGGITRSAALAPGEHTLHIQADGEVKVAVSSKTMEEIMSGGATSLYSGPAEGASFTVPEDSNGCNFTFTGSKGVTVTSVEIDGKSYFNLRYPLFPDFVMNRVQTGLITGDSFILRYTLWKDGLKLFRLSPVYGFGIGAFETGITRVQDFYFATRYVHNHYIQAALEGGVISFLLFAGTMVSLGVCLWKRRKRARDSEFFWIHSALCAELVMCGLQMLWDVFMNYFAFLVIFPIFTALVVKTSAIPQRVLETKPDRREQLRCLPTRIVGMLLTLCYAATVSGNLYVKALLSRQFPSNEVAYQAMERSVRLDVYEHNDVMLTHILMSMGDKSENNHREMADEYAKRLSLVQSNQLPYYLAGYYFNTGRYLECAQEAVLGATYSLSDANMWNQTAALLKQGFIDSGARSPLVAKENGQEILGALAEYRQKLLDYNARSIKPIKLTDDSKAFFDKIGKLADCNGNIPAMARLLIQS